MHTCVCIVYDVCNFHCVNLATCSTGLCTSFLSFVLFFLNLRTHAQLVLFYPGDFSAG